jgi:hypothetical protein
MSESAKPVNAGATPSDQGAPESAHDSSSPTRSTGARDTLTAEPMVVKYKTHAFAVRQAEAAITRAEAAEAAREAAEGRITALEAALERIARWFGEFPKVESRGEVVSYGTAYGSNGERDYMRSIAEAALRGSRASSDKPI